MHSNPKVVTMKTCRLCKIGKSLLDFYGGRGLVCKICICENAKAKRAARVLAPIQKCRECQRQLPLKVFAIHKYTHYLWRQSRCRRCITRAQKRSKLKHQYKITPEQFEFMKLEQEHCCKLCGKKVRTLHIDHDHKTGLVRGLLCFPCNVGLGFLKDDPSLLRSALNYLQPAPTENLNKNIIEAS